MVTVEKCSCGHPSCRYYWLVGIGSFTQGSGFTHDDAQKIADLLNAQNKERGTE
jgi:hypothetical protein